jgi:hypothetical protein
MRTSYRHTWLFIMCGTSAACGDVLGMAGNDQELWIDCSLKFRLPGDTRFTLSTKGECLCA